jgi:hypothetical protein
LILNRTDPLDVPLNIKEEPQWTNTTNPLSHFSLKRHWATLLQWSQTSETSI